MQRLGIYGLPTRFSSSVNLTEPEKRCPPLSTSPPGIPSERSSHVSSESTPDQQLSPHDSVSVSRSSNNVNSVISGDTNTHINNYYSFTLPVEEPRTSNGGTRPSTLIEHAEDASTEPKETSIANFSTPLSADNLPPERTSEPVPPILLKALNSVLNDTPAEPIPLSQSRAAYEVYPARSELFSILSSTKNTIILGQKSKVLVAITSKNIKYHVPKTMGSDVLRYMSSDLFLKREFIPLWDPSPSVGSTGPHAWRRHICIGDVGYFNERGGFSTLFNVFQTVEQNLAIWEHSPPTGFTPCLASMSDITDKPTGIREDPHFEHDMMYTSGFKICEHGSDALYSIQLPRIAGKKCYALHMMHGYLVREINVRGGRKLERYLLPHLDSWRQQGEAEGTWPWILITGTYKAKSWSMAIGTKAGLLAVHPTAELKKSELSGIQHWSTSDRSAIQTRYGPDSDSAKRLKSYMTSPGAPLSGTQEYQDPEECHCVALRAFSLNLPEKEFFTTQARGSYVGSNFSLRSMLSWRTTPTNYRPMNLERITEPS